MLTASTMAPVQDHPGRRAAAGGHGQRIDHQSHTGCRVDRAQEATPGSSCPRRETSPRSSVQARKVEYCRELDPVDPVLVLMATGLRRSELLAPRWEDFDEENATLSVAGKVVRAKGEGLKRLPEPKTDAGYRTAPLPKFAVAALAARRSRPFLGQQSVIFPSTAGTLRDPNKARQAVAQGSRRPRRTRRQQSQFPQDHCHPHRRRGSVGPDRGRPTRPLERFDDPGPLHEAGHDTYRGSGPNGPNRRHKR